MKTNRITLDVLRIDEPCPASWEQMPGDTARRFCDDCGKHVHDAASMTRAELEAAIQSSAGVCLRVRSTRDGTVITRDTPRWYRWSARARRVAMWAAAVLLAQPLAGCLTGAVKPRNNVAPADGGAEERRTLGRVAPPALVGEVSYVPPTDAASQPVDDGPTATCFK